MAQGQRTIPMSKPTGLLKGPAGLSVEEARRQMLESAETAKTFRFGEKVPEFIKQEREKSNRGVGGNTPVNAPTRENPIEDAIEVQVTPPQPVPTQQREPAPQPVPVAPVVATAEPERQPVEDDAAETIETNKFTGRIFKEGRMWVAELTYKNGAGTERFEAPTQRELNKKLLEAKGHGTVKVQEVNHRLKGIVLGDVPDTWDVFFQEARAATNVTLEEYNSMPEAVRSLFIDTAQAGYVNEFKALYPDYYATQENFKKIGQYLNSRKIPLTLHNLELAYRDLTADEILDVRPQPEPVPSVKAVSVPATVVAPLTVDSATEVVVSTTPIATQPRKRGTSGLIPGQSSAVLATESVPLTEDGKKSQEPSEQELREAKDAATRGDFTALKRIATANRKYGARY